MKVLLGQIPIVDSPAENLRTIAAAIEDRPRDVDLVVFPEYALSGLPSPERLASKAFHRDLNEAREHLTKVLAHTAAAIVPMLHSDGRWRSAALFYRKGRLAEVHHKSIPSFAEREMLAPGDPPTITSFHGVESALLLCSEGNGSELIGALSMLGARLIIQPAYPDSMAPERLEHGSLWDYPIEAIFPQRVRMRAFCDQVYIVSVVPAGCGARSRVVAPTGDAVACAPTDGAATFVAEFDPSSFPFRNSESFERRRCTFLQLMETNSRGRR